MKRIVLFTVFLYTFGITFGQSISSKKWSDLFSYNNILAIKEDNGKFVAATENGIFYHNISSGEITKLSKANGLHDVKITAFDYNPTTKIGLVGYKNGSMDVITEDGVTIVIDIPIASGYNGDKKINHISITGDKAVVSVGYGVSIFDLKKKEFAQTAFFNTGSSYLSANEATIKDDKVYVATNLGLKTHDINVTFPVYSTWATLASDSFPHIDSESIIAYSTASKVYFGTGSSFSSISQNFTNISDVVVTANNIIVTDKDRIYTYNTSGSLLSTDNFGEECNTANFINGKLYGGTKLSGVKDLANNSIKPDGPYSNRSYKIHLENEKLWVSTGARENRFLNSSPDAKNLGFYYFTGTEWIYSSFFKDNTTTVFNVMDAVPNPTDLNEVFFTNFTHNTGKGVYKMKYDDASKDFALEKFYPMDSNPFRNLPLGLAYDESNNLFGSMGFYLYNSAPTSAIMVYDKTADTFVTKEMLISSTVQKPIIYDGKLWIPLPRTNHFIAYDYNNTPLNFSDDKSNILSVQNGLPSNSFGSVSVAIDQNDDAWIGSDTGLRILPNASTAIENNPTLENIVIEQNGIPEELFRDNQILQIEVDSGNHKWVSVDGGGVYYMTPNGENTLKHFTKENSPIPTNSVTDIKVDNKTGKVYFVTFEGIVVYQGDVVNVTSDFGDVLVYPNPVVQANFKGNVTIRGLAQKTNIRIVDAAGNLVHQAVAKGGFYEWNLNNQRGQRVASGIYYVLMTNEDGTDKATAKIAVVN